MTIDSDEWCEPSGGRPWQPPTPIDYCPYTFDEPVGSGIPSLLDGRYWCMAGCNLGYTARRRRCPEDCPFDFGEWGAWRAAVAIFRPVAEHFEHWPWIGVAAVGIASDGDYALEAVGWSA